MEEISIIDYLMNHDNMNNTVKINLDDFYEEDVWWYNEESQQMLNSGYFLRGETLFQAVDRICWSMAQKYPEFTILAYNNFVRSCILGWQSFSSPIWSNTGTKRGLPISCFGVMPDDDMISIADKLSETIIQTKLGGGTSGYFGGLRGKGTPVKDNGTSSGSVSFMQLWDKAMSVVSQGSCYKEGTEVLTQFGYIDFRNVIPGYHKIYQVNDKNIGSFTDKYELTQNNYTGKMFNIKGLKTEHFHNLIVTGNHRMVINRRTRLKENNYQGKKYWEETNKIVTAEKLKFHRDNRMPVSSYIDNNSEIGLSLAERLKIAYQADGKKSKETHKIRFHFSKERKINRLSDLLNQANISFDNVERTNYGSREISFDPQLEINKHVNFEWVNLENVSLRWCKEFLDELKNWDGCQPEDKEHFTYSSIDYVNIEKIQAIASICGYRISYSLRPESETKQVLHKLTIFENTIYKSGDALTTDSYDVVDEKVYCCIVPEGRIMVKYDNHITQCGNTRRGNFAAYLDIDHTDIEDFLNIKDVGNPIQNLFTGVNVPDWWMHDMVYGETTSESTMEKRKIWAKVLESRQQKGLPYIFFSDTINRGKPEIYKELNETIWASNLCSEIALPSSPTESFVCCLSSMNLELYDDWKDTDAVHWAILFLDAVMSDFIEKTENLKHMEATHNFAKRHRALGLGVMGYHTYLQKNMIPFESYEATRINNKIFKQIKDQAYDASEYLMELYGPAPIFNELKNKIDSEEIVEIRRNTTLLAIAPTTSSSSILGQASPGIEPYTSNYYKVGLAKGNFMRINKYLKKLLVKKGIDNEETLRLLMLNNGSVQHIEELTEEEKAVFKTFREISPMEIISQAAQRQKYIDQSQSLNLQIPNVMPIKDVNYLFVEGWKKGIKTFYYQRSNSVSKEMMTNFVLCNSCEA